MIEIAPAVGVPKALNIVLRFLELPVVSHTTVLTCTQVNPLPVTVGILGLAVILVRESTDNNNNLLAEGVIEAVDCVEPFVAAEPKVKFAILITNNHIVDKIICCCDCIIVFNWHFLFLLLINIKKTK